MLGVSQIIILQSRRNINLSRSCTVLRFLVYSQLNPINFPLFVKLKIIIHKLLNAVFWESVFCVAEQQKDSINASVISLSVLKFWQFYKFCIPK